MAMLRKYGLLFAGLILSIVGAALLLSPASSYGFGWTAYAPLNATTFAPMWMPPTTVAGVVLIVAGLVLVAGWVGFRLGRRRA